jgi:hypothetical protein
VLNVTLIPANSVNCGLPFSGAQFVLIGGGGGDLRTDAQLHTVGLEQEDIEKVQIAFTGATAKSLSYQACRTRLLKLAANAGFASRRGGFFVFFVHACVNFCVLKS